MPAYLQHLSTLVPEYAYQQSTARDIVMGWTKIARTRRIIHALYDRSGIQTRYSVCGDFSPGQTARLYVPGPDGIPLSPGTGERNAVYATAARDLAVNLARQTLAGAPEIPKEDITHLIFVSCTGFANPGPDYHIIRELGLSNNVQRYTLGFMGCCAAFPALRMAAQFCEADPEAVVLVVCLELCSLHLQFSDQKPDFILANSLFADGAGAALVTGRPPAKDQPAYQLQGFSTSLVPAGEQDMTWDIGNEGFNLVLSSYVPDVIAANIRELMEEHLAGEGISLKDIETWAVHPGGRAILDRVQESLGLPPNALDASRKVLRNFGNMSSATILFVLKEMLETDCNSQKGTLTCAMAFGPGLTVETAVLNRIASKAPRMDTGLAEYVEPVPAELGV